MNKTLESVSEFHKTFGAPVLNSPQVPGEDRVRLRLTLILEELSELAEASGAAKIFNEMMKNKVAAFEEKPEVTDTGEALDALCDLQVVLNGSTLEYGLQGRFDEAFDEVHRSNMSKACASQEEAEASVLKYQEQGVETVLEKVNGKYVIYRASDHKILKGINYFSPDISQFAK
ncbi:nucleoside triphosphate pyrophosphohydrolase family protein [Fulvivirgaceae bacterium BMA12]|uniref:Nucleoside triphosphate pyrophosphohydrolase family protein n=1 Tax=Agaribacillus aureus TaxID=3051825 RepID=A0ABT8LIN5_9BACT|nr:nucleoside triphosphate pyrophosphohydrolase family protein [Fulvivirgaceae bacterium BMA12]